MSRGQADELIAEVELMGWRISGLHQVGNTDKRSFDMIDDHTRLAVCIEDRLDYERKLVG